MPDISIIVPIYNIEQYLEDCLGSVSELTKKADAEVILVDDGSMDGSNRIASRFAEGNSNFRLYRREHSGIGASRNYGVSQASGRYIMFVDADDMIIPDTYVEMLDTADRSNADFCICRHLRIRDGVKVASSLCNKSYYGITSPVIDFQHHSAFIYDVVTWDKLIRKSFYDDRKISFPEGCIYEDYPTTLTMYLLAEKISVCWKTGYLWRIRTEGSRSITQDAVRKKTTDDKFLMFNRCIEQARKYHADLHIQEELTRKLIVDGLNSVTFLPDVIDEEDYDAHDLFQKVMEFVEPHMSNELLRSIPAVYEEIYRGIKDDDAEKVARCVNYMREGSERSPFIYKEDGVTIRLPEKLFEKKEKDAATEIKGVQPTVQITNLVYEDHLIHFYGHVFRKRVQASREYPQEVKALIVNNHTDEVITLPAETVSTPQITNTYGKTIDYDDYRTRRYNYDGAGFHFYIDLKEIDSHVAYSGDLPILIYHKTILDEGTQILAGPTATVKQALKKKYKGERSEMSIIIDKSGAFFLRKEQIKKQEEISDKRGLFGRRGKKK